MAVVANVDWKGYVAAVWDGLCVRVTRNQPTSLWNVRCALHGELYDIQSKRGVLG